MLECGKYSPETLSDLQDKSLPLPAAWIVQWHIKHCPACAGEWDRLQLLQNTARAWHSGVTVPERLQGQYPRLVSDRGKLPINTPVWYRAAIIMGMTAALPMLFLVPVLLLGNRPDPAFAEVEQAIKTIKTARWVTNYSSLDCRTNKSTHSRLKEYARLDLPALRTEYDKYTYEVKTPESCLTVAPSAKDPLHLIAIQGINNQNDRWPQESQNPRERFRQRLINDLLESRAPLGTATGKPKKWLFRMERINGRMLQRFDDGIVKKESIRNDRLIGPGGFRRTIWADPVTHRVARSRTEYYDGVTHTIFIHSDFHYDEPLADSLFRLKPPAGVTLQH